MMKNKSRHLLSRREFARRAALLSATAPLVSAEVMLPTAATAQESTAASQLTPEGQVEVESRYQQILGLYGSHLDDQQKANIKRMCAELQPSLERIRSFTLENGDAPALYLKPLVEREKKPQPTPKSQPVAGSKKS